MGCQNVTVSCFCFFLLSKARDARVTLIITSCPPGYSLRIGEDGLATCLCVGAEDTPFAVLDCSAESNSVLLRVRCT